MILFSGAAGAGGEEKDEGRIADKPLGTRFDKTAL
jgi:hypothetical protein